MFEHGPASSDALRRYILAAARPFEELRDVARQLAGLAVLAASGTRAATLDHPMLLASEATWRRAADAARSLSPPPHAAHHHAHLLTAARLLEESLVAMAAGQSPTRRLAPSMPVLRLAWNEIVCAAKALPGFQAVNLAHACCAAHAGLRRPFLVEDMAAVHSQGLRADA